MSDPFERDLVRGSLDLLVLSVLAGGAKYGYLIQKELRAASAGKVQLPAGTLYPLLHRLETQKLIASRWDETDARKRKWYELSQAGHAKLAVQADQWQRYAQCVTALLNSAGAIPKPANS